MRREGQLCTSLYDKRDDFDFLLQTARSFPSSIFQSWSWSAYGILFHNLNDMPGFAPFMNASFWWLFDFPINLQYD